jgi:hypothetical protein
MVLLSGGGRGFIAWISFQKLKSPHHPECFAGYWLDIEGYYMPDESSPGVIS